MLSSDVARKLIASHQRKKLLAEAGNWRDEVVTREPHHRQLAFIESPAKRKIIRAGRRGGKTTGVAILALKAFLAGKRVLYAAPTADQLAAFWSEIMKALHQQVDAGVLYQNKTLRVVEVPNTENRIRAKTAWNAETLRGDYADLLILDEYQMMDETAWNEVGAPMLLDNDGDAVFIYTPPSLHSRSISKARDIRHASKLFKTAEQGFPYWETFHFTSHDNPHISQIALGNITKDMTALAYAQEIMAEDRDENPSALWTRAMIDAHRTSAAPDAARIVVGVDPPGGATECGIVVAALGIDGRYYVLDDLSLKAPPEGWASVVMDAYKDYEADWIIAESNFGGDMVRSTLRAIDANARVKMVRATRGKAVRAEPISARYERGEVSHIGSLYSLEEELCMWQPASGMSSPNRLDAMVWALTELTTRDVRTAKSWQG